MDKKEFYSQLCEKLVSLTAGVPYETANAANAAALLFCELPDISWAGFYFRRGEKLVLGPFQGRPACIEIPLGKGVCGSAAQTGAAIVVPDVHAFPGHIACDSASNSEIVVPVFDKNGRVIAVLDIDSESFSRFDRDDAAGLESFAREVAAFMCRNA